MKMFPHPAAPKIAIADFRSPRPSSWVEKPTAEGLSQPFSDALLPEGTDNQISVSSFR